MTFFYCIRVLPLRKSALEKVNELATKGRAIDLIREKRDGWSIAVSAARSSNSTGQQDPLYFSSFSVLFL